MITPRRLLPLDLTSRSNPFLLFLFLPLLLHWKTLGCPQLFQAVLLVLLLLSLKQGKAFLLALQLPAPASGLLHRPLGRVGGKAGQQGGVAAAVAGDSHGHLVTTFVSDDK